MRGLLEDLNEDEMWGSSHTLKSCGKAVSIETASLSEYARYVLRTICQQVICKNYSSVFIQRNNGILFEKDNVFWYKMNAEIFKYLSSLWVSCFGAKIFNRLSSMLVGEIMA